MNFYDIRAKWERSIFISKEYRYICCSIRTGILGIIVGRIKAGRRIYKLKRKWP
jgi:hypothetical protein